MFVVLGGSAKDGFGLASRGLEVGMTCGTGNDMRGGDCQDGMGGLCRSAMCE